MNQEQKVKIRSAFSQRELRIQSISTDGKVEWKRVLKVHRADVHPESIWRISTEWGSSVFTGGHLVYLSPTVAVEAETLRVGDKVLGAMGSLLGQLTVLAAERLDDRQHMYDLTVEGNHNLVSAASRICSHNSPSRNYHFRPPSHEETINQYNRVFGYIWLDDELQEYLQRSLDMIIAAPPRTPFASIDQMIRSVPEWRTLLLNGAMMHAIFAVMLNWIADEFNYTIGGVSLDLEKSSKYESAYNAMSEQFQSQLDKAKATVKIVKGLQQPKFSGGVRSSFGPFTGKGILQPSKFLSGF